MPKLLLFILAITFYTSASSQNWSLKLSSTVELRTYKLTSKSEIIEVPLGGAIISLLKGSSVVKQIQSSSNGNFDIEIPANGNYIIEVSYTNCNTKRFSVSTIGVPESIANDNYKPSFGIQGVIMAKALYGIDYSVLNQPLAKIYYIDNGKKFDDEDSYTNQMLSNMSSLRESENKLIEKFTSTNKIGDVALQKGDCPLAKTTYENANSIIPGEQYPYEQLLKVELCLKEKEEAAKKAEKEAADKALIEKEKKEKELANKIEKERLEAQKIEAAKLAKDKEAADKLIAQKIADEKAANDKLEKDKADASKLTKDKEAADKLIAQKIADEKAANDKLEKDKADAAKLAKDKETADKLIAQKIADEKAAKDKLEKDKADAAKLAKDKEAADKLIAQKIANEKAAKDKLEKDKTDAAKLAKDKEAADKLIAQKIANEKAAKDKLEKDKADAAKLAKDKEAADKLEKEKITSTQIKTTEVKNDIGIINKSNSSTSSDVKEIEKTESNHSVPQVLGANQYKETIKKADGYMKMKRYQEAKTAYEEALTYKKDDVYAKTKLIDLQPLLIKK